MSADLSPLPTQPPPLPLTPINPWKGLHSYSEDDRRQFFGRKAEAADITRLISRDLLTIVFGPSGLGKTSVLRAGVFPLLRQAGLLPVLSRFRGDNPHPCGKIVEDVLAACEATRVDVERPDGLDPETSSLWEFFHATEFWSPRNDPVTLVLVLDQFEEVFTLGRGIPSTASFLEQLADLVEDRVPQSVQHKLKQGTGGSLFKSDRIKCKVVLSLREDFVPRLDSLRTRMPAVLRNRYCLEPLTKTKGAEVIHAGAGFVSDEVAGQILDVVASAHPTVDGGDAAEIEPAYLSLMCDELFRRMVAVGAKRITSDLLAAEKGNILGNLYERGFDGLTPQTRVFVEDRLVTASGFRCTLPVADAIASKVPESDLVSLEDRRLLRREDRHGTTHVELSHDLLTDIARSSRERRTAIETEKVVAEQQRQLRQKIRKSRIQTATALSATLVLLAGATLWYFGWVKDDVVYAQEFSRCRDGPYPYGYLTKSDIHHRSSSLEITSRGRWGPVLLIRALDSKETLTSRNNVGTLFSDSYSLGVTNDHCTWEFVRDHKNRLVREVARDKFGRLAWVMVYAPTKRNSSEENVVRVMFLGSDGCPRPMGASRAEVIEIGYNRQRFERIHRFLDIAGNPAPGPDGAYARQFEYDAKGRIVVWTSLGINGQPINDELSNSMLKIKYNDKTNTIESTYYDAKGETTLVYEHFKEVEIFDQYGRIVSRRFFDLKNRPCRSKQYHAHLIKYEYDERGNTTSIALFGAENDEPISGKGVFYYGGEVHRDDYEYDKENQLIVINHIGNDAKPTMVADWRNQEWSRCKLQYDEQGFLKERRYFDDNHLPVVTRAECIYARFFNNEFGQPQENAVFRRRQSPSSKRIGGLPSFSATI